MVLSIDRWVGKVAIVTGTSSGIGAAIAEQLVKKGIKVVGIARRAERVEALAKKLAGCRGRLYPLKCDVSKEADILKAFKWVKENVGPVSILVNNAGVGRNAPLVDGESQLWRETFDINVMGLCIATREAIKDMKANKIDGHIIHINSVLGHYVPAAIAANVYPASKYAVTALTETLRNELNSLQSKIKVTSVSPGSVRTEILSSGGGEHLQSELKAALEAEDIADAVTYALSTPPHVQVHELTVKPIGEAF